MPGKSPARKSTTGNVMCLLLKNCSDRTLDEAARNRLFQPTKYNRTIPFETKMNGTERALREARRGKTFHSALNIH